MISTSPVISTHGYTEVVIIPIAKSIEKKEITPVVFEILLFDIVIIMLYVLGLSKTSVKSLINQAQKYKKLYF
jgi:hypothetical protein